jgi:hypothetical protein
MSFVVYSRCFFATAATLTLARSVAQAQPHVTEPAVNLGGSSFVDGAGGPGVLGRATFTYSSAHHLNDGRGEAVPGSNSSTVVTMLAHVAYTAPWTWNRMHWGADVIVPVVSLDAQLVTIARRTTGLGDLTLSPLIVQLPTTLFAGFTLLHKLDLGIITPTGSYDRSSPINLSRNAWSVNPFYAFTLMRGPWETSWRLHYLWNGSNTAPTQAFGSARSIQAGQAVHANVAVSYAATPRLRFGVAGYVFKQITDQRIDDVAVPASREQVAGIGPGVQVAVGPAQVVLNTYVEFAARNRFEGLASALTIKHVW